MRRREFIAALGSAAAWPVVARAQQAGGRRTVGILSAGSENNVLTTALVAALGELGWVEGKNVVFEHRYAENRLERLPGLAADLVGLKVDVIAAGGTLAPLAAKQASSTIPIVMTAAGDPLGSGLGCTCALWPHKCQRLAGHMLHHSTVLVKLHRALQPRIGHR